MKILLVSILIALTMNSDKKSIYDYTALDNANTSIKLSDYKGKKLMIVNVASKCGLTGQYEQLEAIYKKYNPQGFEIIAFPSNDFMGQEPGTNEEIAEFCKLNYGVTFKIMNKVKVKGKEKCEIYKFLTQKELNGLEDNDVQWNFQKYLINKDGHLEKVIGPRTSPDNEEIISWIEGK